MDSYLAFELTYADGQVKRFGPDEKDDADLPHSAQWSTQIPGGDASASVVLPRPPSLTADDAKLFSTGRFYGPGAKSGYRGRVVGSPQVSADEIRIELAGLIDDTTHDETFRALIIDRDLSHFGSASTQFQLNMSTALIDNTDAQVVRDTTTGNPSLKTAIVGAWAQVSRSMGWYDGQGLDIAAMLYEWQPSSIMNTADGNWSWYAFGATSDVYAGGEATANLRAPAGSGIIQVGSGWTTTKKFVGVYLEYAIAAGANGTEYAVFWPVLAPIGNHGLTKHGSAPNDGFYASDIIGYVLDQTAPDLTYSLGNSIEQSTLVIPHLTFFEPTTGRAAIEQITQIGSEPPYANDWGVYDGEFFWKTPGTYGKTWRCRRDTSATPSSDGPDASSRINGMRVVYRDGAGRQWSAGPPGSNADLETTALLDTDPANPASRLSRKWKNQDIGTIANQSMAVSIGQMLLTESNRIDWRGSVDLQGTIYDDAGNPYAPWEMRSGDQLIFEDDTVPTARPIVQTDFNNDSLSVKASIGAPPKTGDVFLGQLGAAAGLA